MIIDANNMVLGRLASSVAKRALLGEKIDIVNSREAVIIGDKRVILERYLQKKARGNPHHGPFFPLREDRIIRRTIRNMVPHRHYKGKNALKNIRCFLGTPDNVKKDDIVKIENAMLKSTTLKYMKLKDLVNLLNNKK